MGNRIRKSQKKQIEDMLAMLDKAHEAIRKAVETGNRDIALSLLQQCQEIAIQMGEVLEKSFGENFATIGMLESYCERIYQTYESLQQQQPANAGKIYKTVRKELIRIENSVKNDVAVQTVAVFLPYKASMWDSLESVWQAADADPNCDAYVVPIPYFDKNPDGSFREMHYEGYEYPEYVPITSWQEFDLATEHPDMIFIHNPYDEFNLVTSVPPAYYAKELRKHTDQLVYIPYFILGEIEPDNKEAVEGIEHFCAVPAVAYADKVIVQSEKMRQIYIDVMSKTMGRDTRRIWEKKILGLGSPKIDRVQSTKKDKLEIPKDWLDVIQKPDGSRKKIIFYNTSVSALLQHSEKMLDKLVNVLSIFKENQEEIALLWRPHPLIKATIESMRPQLWMEYDKLVRQYKEEGWGIYDDTADVDRVIALSDAYYGDPSSLVRMYQETGKPIMLQNVEIIRRKTCQAIRIAIGDILEKGKIHLQYRSGIRVKDKFYFSEMYFNGLFEMDLNDFSIKLLCYFSGENRARMLMHTGRVIQYKNMIYFFPLCSRRIHYYDLMTGEEHHVIIPISEDEEFVTLGVVQRNNKIWLFSADPSIGVFVLDTEDKTVIRAEALSDLLLKYGKTSGFLDIEKEGKAFTYYANDSVLLEIDLKKEQVKEHTVPFGKTAVSLINYHEGMFFFIDPVSGDLYEWGWSNGLLRKYTLQDRERILPEKNPSPPLLNCCFVNGDIYMVPWADKYVMKVKKEEGIIEKAFDYPEDFQYLDTRRKEYTSGMMLLCEVIDNEIWFHPCGGNQLLIYNTVSEQIKGRRIEVDVCRLFSCEGILSESDWKTLDSFCYSARISEQNSIAEEKCGRKIYQSINE